MPSNLLAGEQGAAKDGQKPVTSTDTGAATSELIFPRQKKHVHSSSLVELPDGSLLAAWFEGSGEKKADDVHILGARKLSPSGAWTEPFLLADTPGHPDCNPVLWIDRDEKLWLFWSTVLSNEWESSLVKYRVSKDYLSAAKPPQWHWQDTVHVKPNDFQKEVLDGWPQLLKSVLFIPRAIQAEISNTTYSELLQDKWEAILLVILVLLTVNYSVYRVHRWRQQRTGRGGWLWLVARSCICYAGIAACVMVGVKIYFAFQANPKLNQRLGWMTANQPIQLSTGEIVLPLYSDRFIASIMAISNDGGSSWQASQPLIGYGSIQPTLLERENGQIVALMRENGLRKCIRHSVSNNRGKSWSSVQETNLPNPGSKVSVAAMHNGNWILAYNPLLDGRHSLALAISQDEGASWSPYKVMDSEQPEVASFSYPCIVTAKDGNLHLTYSSVYHGDDHDDGEAIKYVRLPQFGVSSK